MSAAGSLSVVVCAHARPRRLAACLEALRAQTGAAVELIVVADGATAAVRRVLEQARSGGAGPRVVWLDPGRGPAAARNAGWRAARSEFIAFTDDDCVPGGGWAAALLAGAGPADRIVQGAVAPLAEESDRIGPFSRSLWVADVGPFFQTANVLYPRALLERLGGFDERFPAPAGEDTDLAWRALEGGATAVFAPDARVGHAVHEPGWRGLVTDAGRWGSAVRIVKRHPGLRAHFHRRYFWKPAHAALCLAVASIGVAALPLRFRGAGSAARFRGAGAEVGSRRAGSAARFRGAGAEVGARHAGSAARSGGTWSLQRSRVAAVAAAVAASAHWALVHRSEHRSRGSLVRSLPAHLAVDAAELLALARGSLRERTLFL